MDPIAVTDRHICLWSGYMSLIFKDDQQQQDLCPAVAEQRGGPGVGSGGWERPSVTERAGEGHNALH